MRRIWLQVQYFFFGNVDKILDHFNSINRKLDKAVEFHEARLADALKAEQLAKQAQEKATTASTRAATARDNIKNLLGA